MIPLPGVHMKNPLVCLPDWTQTEDKLSTHRVPSFCACLQGSSVISFAQKTLVNGQINSKLHVIELGAAAGAPWPARADYQGPVLVPPSLRAL